MKMIKNPWKRVTMQQLCDLYLEYQTTRCRQSTMFGLESYCRLLCGLLGATTNARSLSALYIMRSLDTAGLKPITQYEYYRKLRSILRWAYKADLIDDISYLAKITLPDCQSRRERLADRYLEADELRKVIAYMHSNGNHTAAYLTAFLAATGLRIGEAIALEWPDIDFDQRTITISKTYCGRAKMVQPPKTMSSNRVIVLTTAAAEILLDLQRYHKSAKRPSIVIDKDLVFYNSRNNNYFDVYNIRSSLKEALAGCDINKCVPPHGLRHTYASLMAEQGIPIETTSYLLGHRSSEITKAVYLHITRQRQLKDAEMLRDIKLF